MATHKHLPRLWFLNRVYWPNEQATSQLLTDLCEELAHAHGSVNVLTSRHDLLSKKEIRNSVSIFRVGILGAFTSSFYGKLGAYLDYYLSIAWHAYKTIPSGAICVIKSDPPLLGALLMLFSERKNLYCIHWHQDVYPEIAQRAMSNKLLIRLIGLLRYLRNAASNQSALIVAPGHDIGRFLSSSGITHHKLRIIPNWAPKGLESENKLDANFFVKQHHLENKFLVAYSGNLGRVHNLEPILEVAELTKSHHEIHYVLTGRGAQEPRLREIAAKKKLSNITFLPPQPRSALASSLRAGHLHFVSLNPKFSNLSLPSKIYGICQAERPFIFIGPATSEPGLMVKKHNMGVVSSDVSCIADFVIKCSADHDFWLSLCRASKGFSLGSPDYKQVAAIWNRLFSALLQDDAVI
jgi:colanic acid biosynthesis glycosyl transferase WcaI